MVLQDISGIESKIYLIFGKYDSVLMQWDSVMDKVAEDHPSVSRGPAVSAAVQCVGGGDLTAGNAVGGSCL